MACKRNRIIELKNFIESLGVVVNIAKNKARGNNGRFLYKNNCLQIEISDKLNEDEVLSSLTHEFAHCVHYLYDKNLCSLNFIFDHFTDEIEEELINVTVQTVPKCYAQKLFLLKDRLKSIAADNNKIIKEVYPDFKQSQPNKTIERRIKYPAKYLLKYDNVRCFNKVYSVKKLDTDFFYMKEVDKAYIRLKSAQRHIRNINSRINRLNKYYNNKSELFARCFDMYCSDIKCLKKLAPKTAKILEDKIQSNKIPELTKYIEIYNS